MSPQELRSYNGCLCFVDVEYFEEEEEAKKFMEEKRDNSYWVKMVRLDGFYSIEYKKIKI